MRSGVIVAVLTLGMLTACSETSDTRFSDAVDACGPAGLPGIEVADEGRSLLIDGQGDDNDPRDARIEHIACVLNQLEVPSAVITRMDRTTSLMGVQDATWSGIIARWTYHPNNGLDIVLELVEE